MYMLVQAEIAPSMEVGWVGRWVGCVNSWWRHQMETFSALLTICAGNSLVPGEFPHKGQWRGAVMLSLIYVWIDRETGDLRRYRTHYDVTNE